MESPPQPTPSTTIDEKSDSPDMEGTPPNAEQNPSPTSVAALVVKQEKDKDLPLGKGKGGLGMVKREVGPKTVPLAAKSKAVKNAEKLSPKNDANSRALSQTATGSGEDKPKVENNLDEQVRMALNRSGTADKVDESKPDDTKDKKKPKKQRDNVAHARRMRFYRSLNSWGLKFGIIIPDILDL